MKKKVLVIVIVVAALLVGAIFVFFRARSNLGDGSMVNPLADDLSSGSTLSERDRADNYLVWNDPGGFKFSYPESWLFDPHEQDVTNYANLDITKRGNEGGIKVLATDSKYKMILDWTKKDTLVIGSSFVETSLAGVKAQKALLKTGGIVIGAIDQGVLYTIELKPDSTGYWETEYNKLIASFTLVYPTNYPKGSPGNQTGSATGTSGTVVEEEEEVVE